MTGDLPVAITERGQRRKSPARPYKITGTATCRRQTRYITSLESDMTAAIFGLLGVIVGAVINGAATALLQRRAERSDRRSAARLVRSELVRFWALAREAARQSPEHLPQLRETTPILWNSYRAVLARALTDEGWVLVARAYAHVDALAAVLVFERDGTLAEWRSREAKRLLAAMIGPVEEAATVLQQATDVPSSRLNDGLESPEFPEHGPVAS